MSAGLSRARAATFYLTVIGAMAIAISAADPFAPRLVYNASASVPIGWYAVDEGAEVRVGDIVLVEPPAHAQQLLVQRGYIAPGVPLLKRIAAQAGTLVCRSGDMIVIGRNVVGTARQTDGVGRPLPRWGGCRELRPGEVFLFNPDAPGSFDGRYLGPTNTRDIIGRARPLWTW